MSLFYSRTETETEIAIQYRQAPIPLFIDLSLMIVALVFAILEYKLQAFCSGLLAVILYDFWRKPYKEVKKALREGKDVQLTGSKWSFTDPLTFKINK